MKEALFYIKKGNNSVLCSLCPHYCLIEEGNRGYCGVRKNIKGTLYALTWGLIISASSDPVEKKPLYHFYPGTTAYSLGGLGCNLACKHCQNHEISQCRNESAFARLTELSPEQIIKKTKDNGCEIIAWTYNEPTIWYEYILETSKLAIEEGIKTVLITNGLINKKPLEELLPFIDAYRVDVKGFTDDFYKKLTGFPALNTVLESAETAYLQGTHVEIVSNIIPGWNDQEEQIRGISSWIAEKLDKSIPWHVTAYHPAHELHVNTTPESTLKKALKIGREEGLDHIYLGNIDSSDSADTHCPQCGITLIKRRGFSVLENELSGGACPECGYRLKMYRGFNKEHN